VWLEKKHSGQSSGEAGDEEISRRKRIQQGGTKVGKKVTNCCVLKAKKRKVWLHRDPGTSRVCLYNAGKGEGQRLGETEQAPHCSLYLGLLWGGEALFSRRFRFHSGQTADWPHAPPFSLKEPSVTLRRKHLHHGETSFASCEDRFYLGPSSVPAHPQRSNEGRGRRGTPGAGLVRKAWRV
jgi:hypothetical protein